MRRLRDVGYRGHSSFLYVAPCTFDVGSTLNILAVLAIYHVLSLTIVLLCMPTKRSATSTVDQGQFTTQQMQLSTTCSNATIYSTARIEHNLKR